MSKIITFIVDEELLIDRLVNDINSGKSTTIIVDCVATTELVRERLNENTLKNCNFKVKRTTKV